MSFRGTIDQMKWIRILRGALCLGIFIYHFGTPVFHLFLFGKEIAFKGIAPPGSEITGMFLFLSGFLITRSLFRVGPISFLSTVRLYVRRLIKLVPSYYFVVFAVYLLFFQYRIPLSFEYLVALITFRANEFSLLSFGNDSRWFINSNAPLWYVSMLFQFYLIIPVLYFILRHLGKKRVLQFVIVLVLGLLTRLIVYDMHQPWSGGYTFMYIQISILGNAIYFVSGMSFAFIIRATKEFKANNLMRILAVMLFIFWWVFCGYFYMTYFNELETWIIFVMPVVTVISAAGVILPFVFTDVSLDKSIIYIPIKFLDWIGSFSYEIYLWHYAVIYYFWYHIPLSFKPKLPYAYELFLYLSVTIIISYLTHKLITIKAYDKLKAIVPRSITA